MSKRKIKTSKAAGQAKILVAEVGVLAGKIIPAAATVISGSQKQKEISKKTPNQSQGTGLPEEGKVSGAKEGRKKNWKRNCRC